MVDKNAVPFEEIRDLISSYGYLELSEEILKGTDNKLCPDIYDAELQHSLAVVDASQLSIATIRQLIQERDARFVEYSTKYLAVGHALEKGQEYNPEESPTDDEPENEEYICHSRTFLLHNAVFYLLLKTDNSNLVKFLNKIKKPHANRFAENLNEFFRNL